MKKEQQQMKQNIASCFFPQPLIELSFLEGENTGLWLFSNHVYVYYFTLWWLNG